MSVAASPKHSTARGRPSTVLHAAYPPPEQPTLPGMGGGGQGVFTVASPKNGTARRLSPPRKTTKKYDRGGEPGACHSPL